MTKRHRDTRLDRNRKASNARMQAALKLSARRELRDTRTSRTATVLTEKRLGREAYKPSRRCHFWTWFKTFEERRRSYVGDGEDFFLYIDRA